MARLSRRGDDLRVIYLDEFADTHGSAAEDLIDRVVTAYGDDSVQQLATLSMVVEGASNLLTKVIEWGRLASYLEQSTRYIYFDAKVQGQYKYFVPNLPENIRTKYCMGMDRIFDLYSEIVRGITAYVRRKYPEPTSPAERTAWIGATRAQACDAARPLLPVATKSTVGIVASAQAIEGLIRRLLSSNLHEAQDIGRMVLHEARKVIGPFLRRTDMPERGIAWINYTRDTRDAIETLVKQYLPQPDHTQAPVTLLNFWPTDEVALVPEMLFESSNHSLESLRTLVQRWQKNQVEEIFQAYIGNRLNRRHKPGRVLELAHYEFEVVGDYGTFRDLQRHRMVDGWEWQKISPNLGFDTPELVIEAGFESLFREGYRISSHLYNDLATFPLEAQYTTLLGHKMRYRFMMNARQAFHMLELRTSPQGHPGYRKICKEIHRLLAEVHPLIGKAMLFVNKSGDPELTRLEAERATQTKIQLQLERL